MQLPAGVQILVIWTKCQKLGTSLSKIQSEQFVDNMFVYRRSVTVLLVVLPRRPDRLAVIRPQLNDNSLVAPQLVV